MIFSNSNIVKMKKELFVEAESIAYLVNNVVKRKLAFANTVCVMAFHNYIEKNNFPQQITTTLNLFTIPSIAEKFGISDIYLDDIRIEIRASIDGIVFPLPKIQIENSLVANFIVVFKGTKNPLKYEALGYMTKENLVFESQDEDYYYVPVSLLKPLSDLKQEISNFPVQEKNFYESEHKMAIESFGAFIDGDLDEIKSIDLIRHVLACPDCRAYFVEYNYLEDILRGVKHYPEVGEEYFKDVSYVEKTTVEESPIEETPVQEIKEEEEIFEPEINADVAGAGIIGEVALDSTINDALAEEIILDNIDNDNIDLSQDDDIFEINENPTDEIINIDDTPSDLIDLSQENAIENPENDEFVLHENDNEIQIDNMEENIITEDIDTSKEIELDIPDATDTVTENQEDEIVDLSDETTVQNDEENNIIDLSSEPDIALQENDQQEATDNNIAEQQNEFSDEIQSENNENVSKIEIPVVEQGFDFNEENEVKEPTVLEIEPQQPVFTGDDNSITPLELIDYNENINIDNQSNIEINYFDSDIQENEPENNEADHVFDEYQAPEVNLHDLYTNNLGTTNTDIEKQVEEPVPTVKEVDNIPVTEKVLETVVDTKEIVNDNPIIDNTKPKSKKIKKGFIIAIAGVLLFLSGGFIAIKFTQGGNGANEIPANNLITDGQPQDINETVANTFKDANYNRKVSKISWEVEQSMSSDHNASEYLNIVGQTIGDNIDAGAHDILLPNNPQTARVLIKLNNMGDVQQVVFAQSTGSSELDNVIEQAIKQVFVSTPITKYVTLTKDTNLIIVVNF